MTDMVAGKNESGFGRKLSEINNLGPADQKEDPSNQPPAKVREESLRNFFGQHGEKGVAGVQKLQNGSFGISRFLPFRTWFSDRQGLPAFAMEIRFKLEYFALPATIPP
jgi:hypothetical protein